MNGPALASILEWLPEACSGLRDYQVRSHRPRWPDPGRLPPGTGAECDRLRQDLDRQRGR